MRVQQFACSLLVALLAARDVICSTDNNNGMYDNSPELQALNVPLPDRETLGLFPRLSAKYWRGPGWAGVRDPALYMLTENEEQNMGKRNGPSLSIVNSLDVLRQRLLLEIARRQMRENVKQAEANRAYLKTVGKRTTFYGSQAIPAQPGHDLEEAFDN